MGSLSSLANALRVPGWAGGLRAVLAKIVLGLGVQVAAAQCSYEVTIIPHPYSGLQFTAGWALNELGHVAGQNSSGGDNYRAFFWSPETETYVLPYPPGIIHMAGYGINDLDQVCGSMHDTSQWYGFVWDRATGVCTEIHRPAWATRIAVHDINNDGFVAGTLYVDTPPSQVHPFLWHDGVFYNLVPDFDSPLDHANAISEQNEIVGHAWNPIIGSAFAWNPPGTVETLEDGYLTYTEAVDNSNNGSAVGRGSPLTQASSGNKTASHF